jgi:hypothetical protein
MPIEVVEVDPADSQAGWSAGRAAVETVLSR